jgi:predicted site-specific integrase-resolvase
MRQKTTELDAMTIDEFCARHSISRTTIYLLWQLGTGPRYMTINGHRRISREAAAAWRHEREMAVLGNARVA